MDDTPLAVMDRWEAGIVRAGGDFGVNGKRNTNERPVRKPSVTDKRPEMIQFFLPQGEPQGNACAVRGMRDTIGFDSQNTAPFVRGTP